MKSIYNSLGSNYTYKSAVYRPVNTNKNSRDQLENFIKQHYKTDSVQLCYKGREALGLILKSMNLKRGSYVAVNGFTCYAVFQAISSADLKPYYIDVADGELNFGAEELRMAIENQPGISVIFVQNTLGVPCDIENIKKLADENGKVIVEDAAHCIGMVYDNGQEVGTVGNATALSFSQDKVIDAVTGGAAIFRTEVETNVESTKASLTHRFATRIYAYNAWLIRKTTRLVIGKLWLRFIKVTRLLPGPLNGGADQAHNLPKWHAAAALQSYDNLEQNILRRKQIAKIYRENLPASIQLKHKENAIYLRFPIVVENPASLIGYLKKQHIYLGDRWYDAPVSPRRLLTDTKYIAGSCPRSEKLTKTIVNLPTHTNVSTQQAMFIVESINAWLQ